VHTFGASNSQNTLDQPFDWLVHLDRQLVSPMELLNVSSFKPHELTQQFKYFNTMPNINHQVKQGHRAPWYDTVDNGLSGRSALIYRALEYLETGPLASGVNAGGRIPGKININALWDPQVFEALCDPQGPTGSIPLTQAQVDALFQAILISRTPNLGTPSPPNPPFGPTDKPFFPLSTGYSQGGAAGTPPDVQYPNGVSIDYTLLRNGGGLFDVPGQTNPYLQKQLLTKIYNNLTTRSNVFAVWLTVGFFEVIDDTTLPVKLGAEIGRAENRQIRRRMFAIVDRSVLTNNPGPQQRFDARQNSAGTSGARVVPYFSIIQ
jgi:hypothetical protein